MTIEGSLPISGEAQELKLKHSLSLTIILVLFSLVVSACTVGQAESNQSLKMAVLGDMPAEVQSAPVLVREAYQFAVANPEIVSSIACYCGCGAMGHTSNYACYVAGEDDQGRIAFDNHALGCSICVDITQDAMRLTREGKSSQAIFSYIDKTYSQYGPSNLQQ